MISSSAMPGTGLQRFLTSILGGIPAVDVQPTALQQPAAQNLVQAPNPLAYMPQLNGALPKVWLEAAGGLSVPQYMCMPQCSGMV